ncbi:site-specific integrase [Acidiphilium sp.]|uniref:tyrosine-type recombinase/integrase n=1 Tax=Acidiphilium sp. TaxID=527 RepID=UPI002584AB69|nr:site-specific integrase [Acidiphilium sp.]
MIVGTGERLPMLIERATGLPKFDATVYILSMVRGRNLATNTITHHLAAIESLLLFCEIEGIDLDERIKTGRLLTLEEIAALSRAVRRPIDQLVALCSKPIETRDKSLVQAKIISLEKFRQGNPSQFEAAVHQATGANRLRVIRSFLGFISLRHQAKLTNPSEAYLCYDEARRIMLDVIAGHIPPSKNKSQREGMSDEHRAKLESMISPESQENPWFGDHVRRRNRLIVRFLLDLGIRRGELLALRVEDIKLQTLRLEILRRPDDPRDPRVKQPTAKTQARILPISTSLAELAQDYILNFRATLRGAKRHGFLFVDSDHGRPLSESAINKLFRELREAAGDAFGDLSAHVLRHSWNDHFSQIMEKRKVPASDEEKQRSYLMGWRDGSGRAATYTKRYTRKRAEEASLAMQSEIMQGTKSDDN